MADIRSKAGAPVIGDFTSPLGSVIVINQTTGDLSVLKTGDVIQTIIASPSSNAATATTLQTPRLINGVAFNGSADIRVPENTAVTQCTQAAGALTFTMAASAYDFRSTTLADGTITTVTGIPANLVLPSGGTLGAPTTLSGRIIRVLINVAGVMEQAIINIAGGNDLSETGVISTTAISAASTASNVFYSTIARTGVAYRVVGAVDAVNTAGAWSIPTFVQGAGGQALTAMSSIGYGQTRKVVTRTSGVTYYSGVKTIEVCVTVDPSSAVQLTIASVPLTANPITTAASTRTAFTSLISPFTSYVLTINSGTASVTELN